jgi:hypothetical protein
MDTAEECICCQAISAVSINMEDGDIHLQVCLGKKTLDVLKRKSVIK